MYSEVNQSTDAPVHKVQGKPLRESPPFTLSLLRNFARNYVCINYELLRELPKFKSNSIPTVLDYQSAD